jgi:hypothetical protein
MSSYFSSLTSSSAISNLSTRLISLRRAISSGDETDDPDNEDSSHISNVLRAYYTEKGRRFPHWLPPDPKSPPPPAPAVAATQASIHQGGGYYGGGPLSPPLAAGRGSSGGGLGDLWGDTGPSQPPPQQQTSSLRLGRSANHVPQQQAPSLKSTSSSPLPRPSATPTGRNPAAYLDRPQQSRTPPPTASARPLPSQRAGSYQTSQAASQGRLGLDRTGSGSSAQERLRARLHGGGNISGVTSSSGSLSSSPSPGYGSGGGSEAGQPYMGADRPWESGNFNGGYGSPSYGSGGGSGLQRKPVGPRGQR